MMQDHTMPHYVESYWTKTYDTFSNEENKPSIIKPPDSQKVDGHDAEAIVIMVILSIFGVVGTMGNGLVLYVFTRTNGKLISTIFILTLAGTDFVTCLFIIPFTVVAIYHQYYFKYDFICKAYQFLITCTVPLSAFIMVAIAVDRYICICHPFAHIMTIRRAKLIVAVLLSFSVILGVITALGYSIYSDKDSQVVNSNVTAIFSSVLFVRNITKGGDVHSSTDEHSIHQSPAKKQQEPSPGQCVPNSSTLLSNEFTKVYQKIYSAFYLCSLLIVLVLYGHIYSSVTKQRAKRRIQKMGNRVRKVNTQCQTDESIIPLNNVIRKEKTQTKENNSNLKVLLEGEITNTCLSTTNHCLEVESETQPIKLETTGKQMNGGSGKERKDHNRLANIKTALMLFIVTIVFIIAFLPAWLMAHRWIPFNSVVFYMYFLYNIGNPVIYAFMNQMFRENMCKIFGHCSGYFTRR